MFQSNKPATDMKALIQKRKQQKEAILKQRAAAAAAAAGLDRLQIDGADAETGAGVGISDPTQVMNSLVAKLTPAGRSHPLSST